MIVSKKFISGLFIILTLAFFRPVSFSLAASSPQAIPVFINEIHYDNTGTDTGEAIEVFGPAGTDLTGWSLVLYNGRGGTVYDTDTLNGSIPDQCGGYGVVSLSYPTDGIQNGSPDGIALVNASNAVVQFLSYEGAFTAVGGPANGLTTTDIGVSETGSEPIGQSLQLTGTGSQDSDFVWNSPSPASFGAVNNGQTCGINTDTPPTVSSTNPADGATNAAVNTDITINFSENVTVSGAWYSIVCGRTSHTAVVSGGPQTYTLNPDTDFNLSDQCTVTVFASQVADQDGTPNNMVSDYSFSFSFSNTGGTCDQTFTPIYDIQGSGPSAAITGVVTTEGVVVSDDEGASPALRGFYIQDVTGDGNAATSDGIFVFNGNSNSVNLGDLVRVTGTAGENQDQTQIASVTDITNCGTGSITPTDVTMPFPSATYLEQYEGMLVRFPQTLYVTEHYQLGRFGQVVLSSSARLQQPTNVTTPGTSALALQAANDLNRIILDDDLQNQDPDPIVFGRGGLPLSASNTLRGGDSAANIVGVMTYTWSGNSASGNAYRLRPINALGGGAPNFQPTNLRPASVPSVGGTVKVAGMNLLNFFNTFGLNACKNGVNGTTTDCRGADNSTEFARQWPKTVAAILAINPDVLGVNEIENDGYGSNSALQFLVDQLNNATAPGTFAFINVDAATGQTNAMGTDAIKVALIYQPASVTPVGQTAALNTTAFINGGDTSARNRASLLQAFQDNVSGEIFLVNVNHLKSKGSACDAPDAGDGQGNCNLVRVNAANQLLSWYATDPTGTGDPDILLIGDYNSYAMEDPITTLQNGGFTNLVASYLGPDAYSYVFDGQWGYLDQALGSPTLLSQISGVADYHINSDEPSVLDYNTDFKSAGQIISLYAPDEFRMSDHDPVVIGLNFNSGPNDPPTVDAGGPYPVNEGGSVQVSATGSDPNGGPLTYAWDLDNNGSFETPGQTVSFSAAALDGPSTATIQVQVTDNGGLTATDQATVNVQNVSPTATLSNNGPVSSGSPVTVSFTNPFDPSAADTSVGLHYAFACDGSSLSSATYANSSTTTFVMCLFNDGPSVHTVRARIIDQDDGFTEYTTDVTVNGSGGGTTTTFYFHGPGSRNDPPTYFLDAVAPTGTIAKQKDSGNLRFNNNNPWSAIGTWDTASNLTSGALTSLSNLQLWLGLKKSTDTGTNFDLLIEIKKNGVVVASSQLYCLTGITGSPAEVMPAIGSFAPVSFNGTSDTLSVSLSARLGTDGNGASCGGKTSSSGLRVYFDSVGNPTQFDSMWMP